MRNIPADRAARAKAVSYIEITTRSRRTLFGAGMHPQHHHGIAAGDFVGGESRDRRGGAAARTGEHA